jgi:hypothetical protein
VLVCAVCPPVSRTPPSKPAQLPDFENRAPGLLPQVPQVVLERVIHNVCGCLVRVRFDPGGKEKEKIFFLRVI